MKNMSRIILSIVLISAQVLFWVPTFSYSEENPTASNEGAESSSLDSQLGSLGTDNLYLDFKSAALINVLFVMSQLTGINFVAGKEIATREVNMVLDNVTLDDALEALQLGTNIVYEYIPERNLYLFRASSDRPEEPPLSTRVFKLYYVRASEMKEIESEGSGSSSSGGSSGGSSSGGSLSEKSGGEQASQILKIVKNILSSRGRVDVDDRSNSLVVTDSEDRLRMVEQAVVNLDRPIDQVLISVYLIETYDDLDRRLGVTWTDQTDGTFGYVQGAKIYERFPFNVNTDKFLGRDIFYDERKLITDSTVTAEAGKGTVDFNYLKVAFKALEKENKLRVLAKPRILVMDNHPALIEITTDSTIGETDVQTQVGTVGSSSTKSAERTETGTTLRVTPLINTDGRITMTVEPRFTTVALTTVLSGVSRADPTTRTARTTMMVNDGQTIVMGGLLSSSQTTSNQKVPLLGDIPVIGEAFKYRGKLIQDRELILFITPFIIRDPSELQVLSVPDERERADDAYAQFWKVKRKKWFKDFVNKGQTSEAVVSVEDRDRAIAETVQMLELQQKKSAKSPAVSSEVKTDSNSKPAASPPAKAITNAPATSALKVTSAPLAGEKRII